jgi:5-methylcytosine-specific restriction endonuclease McrA
MTIRGMAAELGIGYSTMRHWLRRLGLATELQKRRQELERMRRAGLEQTIVRTCSVHGETEFFLRPEGTSYRCLACHKDAVARRRRDIKRTLVQEAGGRCVICGYDRAVAALHFHHVDPASKSFGISRAGVTRSIEKARADARKCILLCSNCHAEVEAGVREIP